MVLRDPGVGKNAVAVAPEGVGRRLTCHVRRLMIRPERAMSVRGTSCLTRATRPISSLSLLHIRKIRSRASCNIIRLYACAPRMTLPPRIWVIYYQNSWMPGNAEERARQGAHPPN